MTAVLTPSSGSAAPASDSIEVTVRNTHADTDTDTETDTGTDTETDTETETGTDTDTETGTDTRTDVTVRTGTDVAGMSDLDFVLPRELEAVAPPEVVGSGRDDVRLLVARRHDSSIHHARFSDLPEVLEAGDLLVVNTSATLAAAVDGRLPDGTLVEVHVSSRLPVGLWLIELRRPSPAGSLPLLDARPGTVVDLPEGARLELLTPAAAPGRLAETEATQGRPAEVPTGGVRLWVATLALPIPLLGYLCRHGRPIRYRYVAQDWGIDAYQTVFANEPGSAEMPSAARPFTSELVTRLVAKGIRVAPLMLHTGVSSLEAHEPPYPEYYEVPASTAEDVDETHRRGGRVIAVGTTVVRALESVADARGGAHPGHGWTETVITPVRGVRVVDGLITGWHEPRASHLHMLEAIAGRKVLEASYRAALAGGYLWHEFGDSHLILP